MEKIDSCLVILSGGQDSTTCLHWAKQKFQKVIALNFRYEQRHERECACARNIASRANIPFITLNIGDIFRIIGGSALVGEGNISGKCKAGLPASFVPGRNIVLLTLAAAYAYKEEIHDIVTGVCQTDYSGYPDCRQTTIQILEVTLNMGMDYNFRIHTPLMNLTKAQTIKLMIDYGKLDELAYTHTCYEGKLPPCGECPACKLREKGFQELGIEDPLIKMIKGRL